MGLVDSYMNKYKEDFKGSDNGLSSGIGIASGALGSISDIGSATSGGKFDYGGQYTMEEAKKAGFEKGQKIGGAVGGALSAVPIVGPALGGLAKIFGGFIAEAIAKKKAAPVLENREAKMNSLIEYQKEKIKENRFFRVDDLNYGQDGSRFF